MPSQRSKRLSSTSKFNCSAAWNIAPTDSSPKRSRVPESQSRSSIAIAHIDDALEVRFDQPFAHQTVELHQRQSLITYVLGDRSVGHASG